MNFYKAISKTRICTVVWRGATAWKAVADASTRALRALPANPCAALRWRARSRGARALLPRAGRGARTLLLTRCPYARCPVLSVRAARLPVSPRSCTAAGGRRARRPTTWCPSPITYEFGQKRRSGRRSASGCARRATRQAASAVRRGATLPSYSLRKLPVAALTPSARSSRRTAMWPHRSRSAPAWRPTEAPARTQSCRPRPCQVVSA